MCPRKSEAQQTSYTDANGTTSTTGYDLLGRKTSLNDGKGTTTWAYDSSSEHRGVVTSEDIGVAGAPSTFTATYNAGGDLATQTYPNGLVATSRYDNDGNRFALNYTKDGTQWMGFAAATDVDGKIRAQTSPQSAQTYVYDYADRLVSVSDAVNGTGSSTSCVVRAYTFDTDSNRTALVSYPAGTGGACQASSNPTTRSNTVDAADRITNAGYTYDTLGRTLTVPATDAVSTGANTAAVGNLTVGYYTNDMVATQTQGTGSVTTTLDPNRNRIATTTNNTTTTTNHYTGDDDSPDWTSTTPTAWTRNLTGTDGDFAATADHTGTVTLQLTNLHGDIIATCADTTTATAVSSYTESTEYGLPRDTTTAFTDYGWLGTKQRSQNALGGLTLMGARLYNPATGRFLTTDPIPGGNPNTYTYPLDPINQLDLTGQWGFRKWIKKHSKVIGRVVAVAGIVALAATGVGMIAEGSMLVGAIGLAATGVSAAGGGALCYGGGGSRGARFANCFGAAMDAFGGAAAGAGMLYKGLSIGRHAAHGFRFAGMSRGFSAIGGLESVASSSWLWASHTSRRRWW
ncbi:RHS repeat-associated protein [Jatrophihabitans sp. GAS493]|uniref:RHS repeat-associated core domain-containing protein n=1 Tax=Jatrophihabitans sp. GAS493 TaxID=1907575 RepID=UPI000BB7F6B1|nr:RHS repeat-associated core domain-containing protein [Jatrophihabitans sp. GAS493]SOD71662.1 RHS repeat-associated protein [Jatrophihabitans sp. GAS493]